jgi:hypothetical protein
MPSREALIADLERTNTALLQTLADVPDDKLAETFSGTWSAREILAHFAGWYDMMGQALERMARGERPSPEGVNLADTETMNARYVEEAGGKSVAQVRKDLEVGLARLEAAVRSLPEDRFAEGKTAARILQTMIGHPEEHLPEIRAWKDRN